MAAQMQTRGHYPQEHKDTLLPLLSLHLSRICQYGKHIGNSVLNSSNVVLKSA